MVGALSKYIPSVSLLPLIGVKIILCGIELSLSLEGRVIFTNRASPLSRGFNCLSLALPVMAI